MKNRDAMRLDRLVRGAGSVVGRELESLISVAERRTLNKLVDIMDNTDQPLHSTLRSIFSGRLLLHYFYSGTVFTLKTKYT